MLTRVSRLANATANGDAQILPSLQTANIFQVTLLHDEKEY